MMPLSRLLCILRVVGKYRLDEFLPLAQLSSGQRMLLAAAPWKVFAGSTDIAHQSRGVRLRLALEELGPVFVKFGQLLSTRPDLVPADIVRELDQLQDNVPPFDSAVFVAIVETALGDSVDNIFASFSRTPLASASVAQVHTAQLKNGRDVVVKAIRPGIRPVIEQDVALMLTLAKLVERYVPNGHRLRSVEVVNDYRHTILDELNLQSEAANASQLRRNFTDSDMLYVPEVFWDYCRQDVMVMERIYGIPVTDIAALQAQNTNMKVLAERGVEIFFTQVFEHNFFHADMHPGNIFVSREHPERPLYIAIDCAIVGSLSRADQYYLGRNLLAIFRRDYRQVAELHVECGWIPENTPINEFESAIRSVCEPIFEKPLGEISYARILITLFQTAQRFEMEIQPSLVLLQKTLLNIEGLGRQLYPQLDLWQTALPFLEKWLRNRFHPRALLQELQRHGPEWLEKFPQVPELLFDAARQIKNFDRVMPDIKDAAHQVASQQREDKRTQQQRWLGVMALGVAALIAFTPDIELLRQIPPIAWPCGLLGLYWLVKS